MKALFCLCAGWLAACGTATAAAAAPEPLPFKVPARLPDVAELLPPSAVHLDGWLGARLAGNERNRLLAVDTEPLLAGYRQKPGSHPWIGEHVGKWLHAGTLAWANTGDPALRVKLDRVAAELIAAQEPDGYLGTYVPEKRFGLYPGADWDVWSHKYNLLGLLTYYQFTGDAAALTACRKMGDLLLATFPAKRSILAAGTHVGMAATSVLEPMVLLYRFTGDARYLEVARYLVQSWDEPNGPKILQTLLTEKDVHRTANAKAYEMLSNLVGLCELARVTGDRRLLEAALNAWQDIVDNRLYLTGTASQWEHFQADHELRNDAAAHVGETCVTVTWIQLNLQLLRLTGEAKFANELERSFYNHLTAAQHPRGDDWCYYTALEGRKAYDAGITCCHSSGPRGLALAPLAAYFKLDGALAVSTFESSRAVLELDRARVTVQQQSDFPRQGQSTLTLGLSQPAAFAVRLRVPDWAAPLRLQVNGEPVAAPMQAGWAVVAAREWKDGDRIALSFSLGASVLTGQHGNAGRVALRWGPFVLAYEEARNPGIPAAGVGLAEFTKPPFVLQAGAPLAFDAPIRTRRLTEPRRGIFLPFADAGATGGAYRVWIHAPGAELTASDSLLADGVESRSRPGNLAGSILAGEPDSGVVTFDGQMANEDWFAVALNSPVVLRRVVFVQGKTFHDGGWFDARGGRPRVQVQRAPSGAWETVGELSEYPATSATSPQKLKPGQRFTLSLAAPVQAVAVRVVGRPASGDNPKQAFSSCAGLEAFAQ